MDHEEQGATCHQGRGDENQDDDEHLGSGDAYGSGVTHHLLLTSSGVPVS